MKTMMGRFCGADSLAFLLPLGLSALLLAGCHAQGEQVALAKPPPVFVPQVEREPITQLGVAGRSGIDQDYVGKIEPAAGRALTPGFGAVDTGPSHCNFTASFGTGEPVGYEWGRSRIGLSFDADRYDIGYASAASASATLRYSIRLSSGSVPKPRNCLID